MRPRAAQSAAGRGAISALLGLATALAAPACAAVALADLVPALGSRLDGPSGTSRFGTQLAALGDVDGDGYDDIAIGAPAQPHGSTPEAGAVYLVYGTSVGVPAADFDAPASATFMRIERGTAAANTAVGAAVVAVGDMDGDGHADLAIGSALGEFNGTTPGRAWVVRGRAARPALIDLDSDAQTTTLTGATVGDGFGLTLAGGGDLNGDGRPDLAIGAVYADSFAGQTLVLYGAPILPASADATAFSGNLGMRFTDSATFDLSGIALALGGDVNGDGVDDLVIGALGPTDDASNCVGGAFVVFGRTGGWSGAVDVQTLAYGQGARVLGRFYPASGANSAGSAVAILGDQNGDGMDEVVVADPDASPLGRGLAGAVAVIYGSRQWPTTLGFGDLDGQSGYRLYGAAAGDKFGDALAAADLNGDGVADLAVAAVQRANNTSLGSGRVFVHFGRAREAAERDLAPWLAGGGLGEIYLPPAQTTDFGSVQAACRSCVSGPRLLLGAAALDAGRGAAWLLKRSDRIFQDGGEP